MVVSIFYEKFRLYFCFLKNESFFLNYKKNMIFFLRLNYICLIKFIKFNYCRLNGLYGSLSKGFFYYVISYSRIYFLFSGIVFNRREFD